MGSLGRPANRYIAGGEIMIIELLTLTCFITTPHVLTTTIVIGVLLQTTLDTINGRLVDLIPSK